jgi:GT2 family glycosyltransferase
VTGEAAVRPAVSVVIGNWNTRDLLGQTLESLHAATRSVTFETIVVDNGSHDGSAELVHCEWPNVELVVLPENRGFAVANNLGFYRARGRYVLLLNSDTIVLPTTLSGLVDVLDNYPEVGCVGARHLNADGSLQRSIDSPGLLNEFFFNSELHRLRIFHPFLRRRFEWWGPHDEPCRPGWVNGACMMVRRDVIDDIGGLDENFFIYAEEVDWCHRMREVGWQVHFTPAAEVVHLGGQAMDNAADRRIVLRYSGQLRFFGKHYGVSTRAAFRVLIAGFAVVRLLLILVLVPLDRVGVRATPRVWELITQERVMTGPATMLRAWWRILWLRA